MHNPPPLENRRRLLTWTLTLLGKEGIRPRRSLSQNFLVEPQVIEEILSYVEPGHRLIEIGAGIGTLTYYLARSTRRYSIHYEIDQRLADIAVNALTEHGILINGDALLHDWRVEEAVGTIPYHITSPILVKIAHSNTVLKAVLVIQRDVVKRLTAKPGSRDYGRLTVLLRTLFEIFEGGVYDPRSFYPPPEVYSQLVVLRRIRSFDHTIELLEEVSRRIFSKRRKKLSKVLREEFGINGDRVIKMIGLREDVRVYMVDQGALLRLVEYLKDMGSI